VDNVGLGDVTLTGGCPPLTLTYTDTVVGVINKRRARLPAFRGEPAKSPEMTHQVVAIRGETSGISCGVPRKPRDNVALRTETDARSPSYPNANMRVVYQNMIPNTNAYAPNFAMDTNTNFAVSAVDSQSNGATIHVYTKAIVELGGSPFQLSSLAPSGHPCRNTGKGQAQVMFDPFANIWVFAEISTSANATLCLYASDSGSVITASYYLYALVFPQYDNTNGTSLLAYPKLALFNNHYALSMVYNQTSPVLVTIDRTPIVAHTGILSYFEVQPLLPALVGMANTTWTPLHNQGPHPVPPSITNGVTFMRQRDNSLDPAAPLPIQDYLDVITYDNIDYVHGNATGRSYSIPLTNFDSSGPSFCIPVPNTNTTLYAGQEWLGGRLTFNPLSAPYVGEFRVVGTFVTEACSTNGARIQWFELQFNSATTFQWEVRQQGVSLATPPSQYLWMPSIAQDKYGNIVLVYSNSSTTALGFYPTLGAFSRVADDPLNFMRYSTGALLWAPGQSPGPAFNTGWGYTSVIVADTAMPVGRSFYAMGTYSPATVNAWQGQTAYLQIRGEIIERNIIGQDLCGNLQTCQFFILDGNV
jgi:hypothetical protein